MASEEVLHKVGPEFSSLSREGIRLVPSSSPLLHSFLVCVVRHLPSYQLVSLHADLIVAVSCDFALLPGFADCWYRLVSCALLSRSSHVEIGNLGFRRNSKGLDIFIMC